MRGEVVPGIAEFAGIVGLGKVVDIPTLSEGSVEAFVVPVVRGYLK